MVRIGSESLYRGGSLALTDSDTPQHKTINTIEFTPLRSNKSSNYTNEALAFGIGFPCTLHTFQATNLLNGCCQCWTGSSSLIYGKTTFPYF